MADRDYLGEFEHIIVLALLRLADQAYGVTVRQEIELRTKREVSIGAVYATLDRLEAKGYVKSQRGDPTPERGGRAKRFFRVTGKGIAAASRTHRGLESMTEGLAFIRSHSCRRNHSGFNRRALPCGFSLCSPFTIKQNPSWATWLRNSPSSHQN